MAGGPVVPGRPRPPSVGLVQQLCGVSVVDVSVAVPAGNGVEAGMVVLQEDQPPYRRIRMYVAQPEARAIRVAWRSEIPPRPSTWDLFTSTVSLLGGSVEGAVLTDVEDGRHYFAELLLRVAGSDEALHVTARPSDAIAVALRCPGARLEARSHVLDGLSRAAVPTDGDEAGAEGQRSAVPIGDEPWAVPTAGEVPGSIEGPPLQEARSEPGAEVAAPGGPKRVGSGGRVTRQAPPAGDLAAPVPERSATGTEVPDGVEVAATLDTHG